MKIKVNLLQESQKLQLKIRRIGLLLQTGSTVVLIGFGVLTVGFLSYTLLITRQQKGILEKIQTTESGIDKLRPVEYKNEVVKNKLILSSQLMEEHKVNHKLLMEFYEFAALRLSITELSMPENTNEFKFQGSAAGVTALVDFLEEFAGFAKERGINSVKSDGFNLNDDGNYDFILMMYFAEVSDAG